MAATNLEASVKTRIPQEWKDRLARMAASETLDVSDIVRRALAEFIGRSKRTKGK